MENMGHQPRIFISYSHEDEDWKDRIASQLGVLEHEGLFSVWDDQRIAGGDDWLPEIETAIQSCGVALLLISAKFLTSKFILGKEVPALLQRREQAGLRVIPVILKPCAWSRIGWLKTIQARPKDGKPLSGMSEYDADTALAALAMELADLLEAAPSPFNNEGRRGALPKIDLSKLPAGAADFLGRQDELQMLDEAWKGNAQIVELVAAGGVGKTALVKRWLDRLKSEGWRGAEKVFGWSFFSQGTREDRQASDEGFLNAALQWFGVDFEPTLPAWDKGKILADVVASGRNLLVLDGIEPLQYPPGPMAGELRSQGVKALLNRLAGSGQPGLCILTTRECIKDLKEYERNDGYPEGTVIRQTLENLSEADGAKLLHRLGVRRAGSASIGPEDDELKQAAHEVHGHALTLFLLGGYLAQAHEGDIRKRGQVDFRDADESGRAFKVMRAYELWFEKEGEQGRRELAALRLLGFFDRPADAACLEALRQAPPIPGLTEPLVGLKPAQWNIILSRLKECGLIEAPNPDRLGFENRVGLAAIDAHPLIRQYLADSLKNKLPEAWQEGHRRLYEYLTTSTPHRPEGLAGLQPLYQAVAHGCQAGLQEKARAEVYRDRILRGTGDDGFYSSRKLGAFGSNLGALACFFDEPWSKVSPALSEADQAWLLNETAFYLRGLGRLAESLEAMRAAIELVANNQNWLNAARGAGNLSELELTLGKIEDSVKDAGQSVDYADQSRDDFLRMGMRTTWADGLHQQGEYEKALELFREAEAIQKVRQPEYPLLYSLQGFRYCDLLLTGAERLAWRAFIFPPPEGEGGVGVSHTPFSTRPHPSASVESAVGAVSNREDSGLETPPTVSSGLAACLAVIKRASQTLKESEEYPNTSILDFALDHLSLGRAGLYRALLETPGANPSHAALEEAEKEIEAAVGGLRDSGYQYYIPLCLLTRAWLRCATSQFDKANEDLEEAWQIASRGGMKLHMADIHLHRARLFKDKDSLPKARELIVECGYRRRLPELEDAEQAAKGWI